jgi:hypothetical protein
MCGNIMALLGRCRSADEPRRWSTRRLADGANSPLPKMQLRRARDVEIVLKNLNGGGFSPARGLARCNDLCMEECQRKDTNSRIRYQPLAQHTPQLFTLGNSRHETYATTWGALYAGADAATHVHGTSTDKHGCGQDPADASEHNSGARVLRSSPLAQ